MSLEFDSCAWSSQLQLSIYSWSQPGNHWVKREVLTRGSNLVGSVPCAVLDSLRNFGRALGKVPCVGIKHLVSDVRLVGIGRIGDYLDPETDNTYSLKAIAVHAMRVALFVFNAIFIPLIGCVNPRWALALQVEQGVVILPKPPEKKPSEPEPTPPPVVASVPEPIKVEVAVQTDPPPVEVVAAPAPIEPVNEPVVAPLPDRPPIIVVESKEEARPIPEDVVDAAPFQPMQDNGVPDAAPLEPEERQLVVVPIITEHRAPEPVDVVEVEPPAEPIIEPALIVREIEVVQAPTRTGIWATTKQWAAKFIHDCQQDNIT